MQVIETMNAPSAIGTYSQAIKSGNTVYISGQIPLNPETMELISDDIRAQIDQVLDNLSAICEAAEASLSQIVKLSIYLTDLSHFPLVNEAMSRYFKTPYPARAAIGVRELPKGSQVEMDGILVVPD